MFTITQPELEITVKDNTDNILLDVFQDELTKRLKECAPNDNYTIIKTKLKKLKRIPVNRFDKIYDVVISNCEKEPITIGKLLIQYIKNGSMDEKNSDEPKQFLFFQASYNGKIPYPETILHLYTQPVLPFMGLPGYQEGINFNDNKYGTTQMTKEEIFRKQIQEEMNSRQVPPCERWFRKQKN
jgi:hypothetical protein